MSASDALFQLSVMTPEKTVYAGKIRSLMAPGEAGYFGILAGHAPFLSTLVQGNIRIKEPDGKSVEFFSTGKGFLEVLNNETTILLSQVQELPATAAQSMGH